MQQINDIFNLCVFEGIIKNSTLANNALRLIFNNYKKQYPFHKKPRSNEGGYQTDFIENNNNYKTFLNLINPELDDFLNKIQFDKKNYKIEVAGAWINENQKDNFNKVHIHPRCDFSLVYYSEVPENSGNLVLYNPVLSSIMGGLYECSNHSMFKEVYVIKPVPGYLIIFPSYLQHYVEPNKNIEPRLSTALNLRVIKNG